MLFGVARFELKYQLRNPVLWFAFIMFFLMGFGATSSADVSIGTPSTVHEDAPYAIAMGLAVITMFYLFVTTAFVANAIVRDDATGFAPMIRSSAVSKFDLFSGRFLGGFVIALLGYMSLPLGMGIGTLMPWVDSETLSGHGLSNYAWHFLIIAVPNIFITCAFLMSLATIFRSMMATYIGLIIFLMSYTLVSIILSASPQSLPALAKFELLGVAAIQDMVRYWTPAEINMRFLPLAGNLLFNRLFLLVLGCGFLALAYWRFSMAERAPSRRALRRMKQGRAELGQSLGQSPGLALSAPDKILPHFSSATSWAQFRVRMASEIGQVLKSPGLIILLLLAVGMTSAELWTTRTLYGTPAYPLTATIIFAVKNSFLLFLIMIAIFYSGELVWRERERKFNELLDATPAADWVMFIPKILALMLVLLLVNLVGLAMGMITQLAQGSTDFSLSQYLLWYLGPATVDAALLAVLAIFLQLASPNKYVGWALMILWFVAGVFLGNIGYQNNMYHYAGVPAEPLSDMNGDGGFWWGATWFRLYWLSFAVLLIVAAHLIWPRGTETALRPRLVNAKHRAGVVPLAIGGVAFATMLGSGLYIHDNIKVKNEYRTADEAEEHAADYEKKYLKYENLPRPVVTAVKINVDLHPSKLSLTATGNYTLRNDTAAPIPEVHVRRVDRSARFTRLDLNGASVASDDKAFGYTIFRFAEPLEPGQSATLNFTTDLAYKGFRNGGPQTGIALNGSFLNNRSFAPVIGMERSDLLSGRTTRRRHGLPAELRIAKLEDMSATVHNYVRADWVMTDITITTDGDQTPIAPGRMVHEATANGRRTMRFVSDAPILDFYSVQSARYAIARRNHNGVALAVYYHPAHRWNVDRMLTALETSLDYYQTNFGPYQFHQARIVEFPGYNSFAQAFANTMPYSESIGFAADVRDPDKIDYVTYVTAHELAHQYWAHQAIGADMQGGTLTTETLAQYSALMVMKKLHGADKIRRFLRYELDDYLAGRKGEAVAEMPLARVENQQYIHYNKGSVVMYLLAERLGEDAVNRALARYVERFRFKGAPFPRSLDVISEFRKEAKTPADQTLITDLFEKITVYDLKAKTATTKRDASGHWVTAITVSAQKYYADEKGNEKVAPLDEAIEIGLFTARPGVGSFDRSNVLSIERRPVKSGEQQIIVRSKMRPTVVGVDPYNFYIDRTSDDNLTDVVG